MLFLALGSLSHGVCWILGVGQTLEHFGKGCNGRTSDFRIVFPLKSLQIDAGYPQQKAHRFCTKLLFLGFFRCLFVGSVYPLYPSCAGQTTIVDRTPNKDANGLPLPSCIPGRGVLPSLCRKDGLRLTLFRVGSSCVCLLVFVLVLETNHWLCSKASSLPRPKLLGETRPSWANSFGRWPRRMELVNCKSAYRHGGNRSASRATPILRCSGWLVANDDWSMKCWKAC